MWAPPVIQELQGARLHLSNGPIDVVLKAWGAPRDVSLAYSAASTRFETILTELVAELGELRRPMSDAPCIVSPVGLRMRTACTPFAGNFITPMAAVAGSVADELMATMCAAAPLERAYVNDGGDIAVHTTPGHDLTLGIAGDFSGGKIPALNGSIRIDASMAVGGIATSGARGRSFSLGIADSVTVLAHNAAAADAAATLIANAVDISSAAIRREPAASLDPDTDLGNRLVTIEVGELSAMDLDHALGNGLALAEHFRRAGLISAAALMLRGRTVTTASHTLASQEARP